MLFIQPFVHESDYTNHAVFYSVKELDHRSHVSETRLDWLLCCRGVRYISSAILS